MSIAECAALTATALAASGALPQVRRLRRSGDIAGLSLSAAMTGVASEVGWLTYAASGSLWSAVPEAVLMLGVNACVMRELVRNGAVGVGAARTALAWGACLTLAIVVAGRSGLGLLLPIGYGVQITPAVWTVYRTRIPSGVATVTWRVLLAESSLWLVYGIVHGDVAMASFAAIGAVASVLVLCRLALIRGRIATSASPGFAVAA